MRAHRAGLLAAAVVISCTSAAAPVSETPPVGMFTSVRAGDAFTCGTKADATAWCWGGSPGPTGNTPQMLALTIPVASIAPGHGFVCGLTPAGAAYCLGANGSGQLGDGTFASRRTAMPVDGVPPFAALSVGYAHACGLTAAGTAWCWGANAVGLGRVGDSTIGSATPTPVSAAPPFSAISAGASLTCSITGAGVAWCWGENTAGQLGDGSTTSRVVPQPVTGLTGVRQVSAGGRHACAITSDGGAWCWGANDQGQLGDGTTTERHAPTRVLGSVAFASISTSLQYTCGTSTMGDAWCWGFSSGGNSWGQLGSGSTVGSTSPVRVVGGMSFVSISAGAYDYSDESVNFANAAHTCGLTLSHLVYCWGANNVGQLGTANTLASGAPVKVSGQP